MSSAILFPDPCLLAILLVCQTREGTGPQLAFSWPPNPLATDRVRRKSSRGEDDDDSYNSDKDGDASSTDSDDDSSEDNYSIHTAKLKADSNQVPSSNSKTDRSTPVAFGLQSQNASQTGNTLLGLDEDGLVGLLAPDRTWHKRKFELSINDLTFVGRPVFAKQDGFWRKPPKAKTVNTQSSSDDSGVNTDEDDDHRGHTDSEQAQKAHQEEAENLRTAEKGSHASKSKLTMFHAVFVMNPPPLDHSYRVKEIYDNVIKKLSKALKWVQAHQDYVWQQTDMMSLKRRQLSASGGWSREAGLEHLLDCSSLAKAIMNVFNAISTSRIASISLGKGMSLSLQIPLVTSTSYLPSLTEPPIPAGLWLTTATEAPANVEESKKHATSSTLQLARSYTLLLKSPPQRITKDAQLAGGPVALHLPKFVAALRPTKSFYKLANTAQISLADIQLLARHLIYWRRAIAIPPLHQRDTYIVSPNANFGRLREACKSYELQFPSSLPSLLNLLSLLSGTPRPFMTLIPSQDHKDIYMLVLAWLMRNGWVTQLRTFGLIRVDADMKAEAKDRDRRSKASISNALSTSNDVKSSNGQTHENQASADSGVQTRPSFVSRQSSDGRQSIKLSQRKMDSMASLVPNPSKATPEESRWLSHVHESILQRDSWFTGLTDEERAELHLYWPKISKYFDGNTALETVPIKENFKRKFVWHLYGKFGLQFERGVENAEGVNDAMIVTVRHW